MNNDKKQRLELAKAEYIIEHKLKLVAKKYQLQSHEFSQYLKASGIEVKNSRDKKSYPEAMREYLLDEKSTLSSICKKYGIDKSTFPRYLREMNVGIRGFDEKSETYRKYLFDVRYFATIDTEEKAYWLGFIAADGSISKSLKQLSINLSSKDRHHLEKISKIFKIPIVDYEVKDKRTKNISKISRLVINSKDLCGDLINKGIYNKKSLTMDGKTFAFVPSNLMHHFVRGYFDGDGCIHSPTGNEYAVTIVGAFGFISELMGLLVKEIGIYKRDIQNRKKIHAVYIGGNYQVLKFKNWLYSEASIFLERKKDKFDKVLFRNGNKSSKYRGVHWNKRTNKWQARIYIDGKTLNLGHFDVDLDAALAYNEATIKYDRPRVRMNNIEDVQHA